MGIAGKAAARRIPSRAVRGLTFAVILVLAAFPIAQLGGPAFSTTVNVQEQEDPENASLELTLRSVSVERVDLEDEEEEFIKFTFHEEVHQILNERGFLLTGPDSDRQIASAIALLIKEDPASVLVGFAAGTDVSAYTIGAVQSAAVANRNGEVNIQDSEMLLESRRRVPRGPTAAPDLLWVVVDPSLDRIRYIYDENLDENFGLDPRRFGFYTRSGRIHEGVRRVSVEDNVVIIGFVKSDQVQEAARFFALHGAAKGLRGHRSMPRAVGGRTTAPDLLRVHQAGDTLYDFVFDEDITGADAGRFAVYTADGARYAGKASTLLDGRTARVVFPEINNFGRQVVLGVVEASAVKSNDGSAHGNTLGAFTIRSDTIKPGLSTGPDLVAVKVDARSGLVLFVFDEEIETETEPGEVKAGRFFIVTAEGILIPARMVADVQGDHVSVLYSRGDVAAAMGATVDVGAVTDEEGNPNPIGTVIESR